MHDFETKTVNKTRKDHRCHGCCNLILKGSYCVVNIVSDEGRIFSLYICEACHYFLKTFPTLCSDQDGRFPENCVVEAKQEYFDEDGNLVSGIF